MQNFDLVLDSIYKSGRIILIRGNEFIYETNVREKNIRSDNVLDEIKSALEIKSIHRCYLKRITLIESKGSVTKNRIFKSISFGIKDALNIELRMIHSSEIFSFVNDDNFAHITAYESDNKKINWFEYTSEVGFEEKQFFGDITEFAEAIRKTEISNIYATDTLLKNFNPLNFNSRINLHQFDLDTKIKTRLIT